MRQLICIVLTLVMSLAVQAQAAMRVYLVPVVTSAGDRVPKYFGDGTITPKEYAAIYYGSENWVVVAANLSTANDALVVAAPDGFALPFDLSQNLTGGQVTAVQTKLEASKIPAQWVSTSLTWKQVLRTVIGMSMILQRFSSVEPSTNFFGVVTLNTVFGTLPAQMQTDFLASCTSLGLNTSSITALTTVREALRIVGEQLRDGNAQFSFNWMLY